MIRPTWLEVDLGAVKRNFQAVQRHVGNDATVIGVVKANAYNLGVCEVTRALREAGASYFAVATPDEALELREDGLDEPILVLGAPPFDAADEYVRHNLRCTLTDRRMAEALSEAAQRQRKTAYAHVKVDTGMGRLGYVPEDVPAMVTAFRSLPGLELEGIYTHFASSDERNLAFTRHQFEVFTGLLEQLKGQGITFSMRHCCNTAGTLAFPGMALDAVRPGHAMVGMYPSHETIRSVDLQPAFQFKTEISALKTVPRGRSIGYGLTYITRCESRIATLPVGYADGYSRDLSNRSEVLVRGMRSPLVGRICMDQMMIDVTQVPEAEVGDEVVLIGRQGDEEIKLEEIADKLDTLVCVIPVQIGKRVPRVYREEGGA
ncbi:MAG: alanine racemase [Synergistales bacterium]|nr:alanine racemase [Synergistales bacterium]